MSHTYISAKLRQLVYQHAAGCCEYCKMPESHAFAPHQIDHIIAEKHGGLTNLDNLALSCILCNKYKGSDISSIDPDTKKLSHCSIHAASYGVNISSMKTARLTD